MIQPLGEQDSNSPLLGVCFIHNINMGGFGELQQVFLAQVISALEGDAFEAGWDGAMHNA